MRVIRASTFSLAAWRHAPRLLPGPASPVVALPVVTKERAASGMSPPTRSILKPIKDFMVSESDDDDDFVKCSQDDRYM